MREFAVGSPRRVCCRRARRGTGRRAAARGPRCRRPRIAARPSTRPPTSPSSRRAPRSTSCSMFLDSSSISGARKRTGSVDVRGFAGTAGNVVINGARPSSKAGDARRDLAANPGPARCPRRAQPRRPYGSDYAGKSQVLNISCPKLAGSTPMSPPARDRRFTGYIQHQHFRLALIRRGPSTFNLSAGTGRNRQYEEGTDTLTDPRPATSSSSAASTTSTTTGSLYCRRLRARAWLRRRVSHQLAVAAEPVRPVPAQPRHAGGRTAARRQSLSALQRPGVRARWRRHPPAGRRRDQIRRAGDTSQARRFRPISSSDGLIEDGATVIGGFEQLIDARRNETIGRVSWTRANLLGLSFEAGAEAAFNTLDDHVDLFASMKMASEFRSTCRSPMRR